MASSMLLHLTTRGQWAASLDAGEHRPPSLAVEGFLHFSSPAQVVESAERHYRGVPDLLLLCVDPERLTAPLRYEFAPSRGEDFPHVYGPLNLDAVTAVLDLPETAEGFVLPVLPAF
jgi:uncharacterized protein (DUF952 family)